MNYKIPFFVMLGLNIIGFSFVGNYYANAFETNYPPTPAFSTVIINGEEYKAIKFDDSLRLNFSGSFTIEETGQGEFTITLPEINCPILQGLKGINADGNFYCAVI